jgi:hypothetical protein
VCVRVCVCVCVRVCVCVCVRVCVYVDVTSRASACTRFAYTCVHMYRVYYLVVVLLYLNKEKMHIYTYTYTHTHIHTPMRLQASMRFGQCVADEWLCVWVLQRLCAERGGVSVAVTDDDG